ncbi:hypothetical protein [Leptothoe spongobia]|uniref:Uncharacterized protein n=1 Tax=Leptothoe spongobia TAU-MAC 1115 TaxID=1967444 RepID=A0A947DF90_9CYAN|nr:hypothetical protein [Leptothoe spongobia]MBT9315796.1 hypothetical protein [Leptothoe spongobia TAU-MAC 1115]
MLNQIQALLINTKLHQQIKKANSLANAISLIKTASDKKGYQFSNEPLPNSLKIN